MKLKVLITALVFCLPLVAQAEGKIAVLSAQEAILNTEAAQARIKTMQNSESFKANVAEVEKISEAGRALVEKLQKDGATMSSEEQMELQKQIQQKQADMEHVRRKIETANKELGQALVREMAPLVKQVVDAMIESDGIGLILDRQAVMHVDTSYNMTSKVTDKLNQANAKK